MARKSSVSKMTPEARSYLEQLLREDRYTLDELVQWVREKFPGEQTSRSALGRYRKSFEEMAGRMREIQAASRVLVAEFGEDVGERSGALLAQAVTTLVANAAIEAHENDEITIKEVGELARAARAAQETRTLSYKEQQALRQAAREELLREQREKLDELGQKGEVPKEMLDKVIKAAYGLELP